MGKKQHQKDKLYLTTKEWKETFGGHKDDSSARLARAQFKRLPFTHCALSLLPFEDAVCTAEGDIFDLTHIIPHLKRCGINPITGEKLHPKCLIHLKFAKDSSGNFRCPVTYKVFTPNSHIVAIKTTGNVYSMEAVSELNLKPMHFKDLLSDEPFTRKDIITLQDPGDLSKFNMEKFHHVKFNMKTQKEIETEKKAMEDPKYFLRKINNEAKESLKQLDKEYKPEKRKADVEDTADEINAAHYSQGRVAAGFTSTVMDVVTKQKAAILDSNTVKYSRVKKNGYVRVITNFGCLNLELFCQQTPKACDNFIQLCKTGYYDNTKFHRLIKNFMLQGGDPTGTGHGGESIWGREFEDEFVGSFSHSTRGILSMANKGTNTNGSQFFISFRPCKHLDGKHTIFGRVVGGMEVLSEIEKVETDDNDKPTVSVVFMKAEIFVDPFEEAEEAVKNEREAIRAKKAKDGTAASSEAIKKVYRPGVGKYIRPEVLPKKRPVESSAAGASSRSEDGVGKKSKLVQPTKSLNDFSCW